MCSSVSSHGALQPELRVGEAAGRSRRRAKNDLHGGHAIEAEQRLNEFEAEWRLITPLSLNPGAATGRASSVLRLSGRKSGE